MTVLEDPELAGASPPQRGPRRAVVRSRLDGVAFLGMDLRIGTTVDGRPAGLDTASTRPLVLVGDAGHGKTTAARHLARWWLAETTRHAHVFATWPGEWADLRCHLSDIAELGDLTEPAATDCHPARCLFVVDDLDHAPLGAVGLLPLGRVPTVLTSSGGSRYGCIGEELDQLEGGFACHGLLPRRRHFALEVQGRLDWPPGTVAVVPDPRGAQDFPCHRWHPGRSGRSGPLGAVAAR